MKRLLSFKTTILISCICLNLCATACLRLRGEPPFFYCNSDADCASDEYCVNFTYCEPDLLKQSESSTGTTSFNTSPQDCEEGEGRNENLSDAEDRDAVCEPIECQKGETQDGYKCDTNGFFPTDGACYQDRNLRTLCANGYSCVEGGCWPFLCETDSQCLSQLCVDSECARYCGDDNSCLPGELCIASACQDETEVCDSEGNCPFSCSTGDECPNNLSCLAGSCVLR